MRTLLLCLLAQAIAQAPGGGQINGGAAAGAPGAAAGGAQAGAGGAQGGAQAGAGGAAPPAAGAQPAGGAAGAQGGAQAGAGAGPAGGAAPPAAGAGGAAGAGAKTTPPAAASSTTDAAAPSNTMDMGPWTDAKYLEGTWQSKSGMVVTGPDFYDPVHELLIDPGLPGVSYSFTSDGYWEEAIYQVTGDGSNPTCPTAIMIFQHGTYTVNDDGSIDLEPFESDGRQLLSSPCNGSRDSSDYSAYSQKESFKEFEVWIDNYYGRYRLNLYKFDGSPVAPLYLAYKPPQMLPCETMNPTSNSSSPSPTGARQRIKRSLENRRALEKRGVNAELRQTKTGFDYLWYGGVSLMLGGGIAFAALS